MGDVLSSTGYFVIASASNQRLVRTVAEEIEAGLNEACRAALKGMASDVTNVVSRDDNLLSTKTLTVDGSLVPKAYPKLITVNNGFTNPALSVQAA